MNCSLKIIILEDLKNLKYIGYVAGTFYAEKRLEFPNLEKLTINNCPNIGRN